MPRRRRGAKAVAVDAEEERGFVMRMLLHSPKDMLAGALAVAAIGAILTNALFLQAGRHPSPMFGSVVKLPAPAPGLRIRCPVRARLNSRCVPPSLRNRNPSRARTPINQRALIPRSSDPKPLTQ